MFTFSHFRSEIAFEIDGKNEKSFAELIAKTKKKFV